jgi:type IV secretory pathway TrbF-like protein
MQDWVQSGDFEIWLKTEFVILHSHAVVADPIEAYKEIAKIVAKMVTQKREVAIDENVTEKHIYQINNFSEEDKVAILNAYERINKQNSSSVEPESLH